MSCIRYFLFIVLVFCSSSPVMARGTWKYKPCVNLDGWSIKLSNPKVSTNWYGYIAEYNLQFQNPQTTENYVHPYQTQTYGHQSTWEKGTIWDNSTFVWTSGNPYTTFTLNKKPYHVVMTVLKETRDYSFLSWNNTTVSRTTSIDVTTTDNKFICNLYAN